MKSNIHNIRQRKIELSKQNRALLDAAAKESRDLNEAEAAKFDENLTALVATEKQLEREERQLELERTVGAVVDENTVSADKNGQHVDQKPKFSSLGEQLLAIVKAERSGGRLTDPRLMASASGTSEAVPSDGGFLVQKDFSAELLTRIYQTGQVAQRCRRIPISTNANGTKINAVDEDSRVDGSRFGGVLAYWINEADALTGSKPKFRQVELNLQKLVGLCYATDELVQDAAQLESVITTAFGEELTFKLEDAILNGTGAGQPLGVNNSGAVIAVTAAAGSGIRFTTTDVLAMYARMWAPSRQNAAWFINQDLEPFLYPLTLGSGTAVQLLYTPPGQNGNQYGMLLGKPVIPVEHCATAGTQGDVVLADMNQYILIDKGAPRSDSSLHVRFLNDEMTFRWIYRVDGQSWWKKPLTPKNGTNTLSPFITLTTRS